MFTPFAFIKRQVSAAIAAIGQRLLLIGNFTAFNPTNKTNGVTLIDGSDQFSSSFNVGSGTNGIVYDAEFDENGKLILGGAFTSYSGSAVNDLVRVNPDGTIDTSLNIGTGTNGEVRVAVPISGGKVLVGGTFSQYSGSTVDRIMRINSNGTLDNTFTSPPFSGGTVRTIVTQSDGKIVVGGTFGGDYRSKPYLNKTTPTNLIDTTFNQGSGPSSTVLALAEQSDGKILMSGNQTVYSGSAVSSLIRINTNGTLDTSWTTGTGGYSILPVSGGKVLVAGDTTIAGIRRYNSNGTTDSSFNVGKGASSTVSTAATQSNGKIIIGGAFTSFGNQGNNNLIKLTSSSFIDYSFNQGTGLDGYAFTFASQSDGKILAGGNFTDYSGSVANYLVRINTDGTKDTSFNTGVGFNNIVYVVKVQPDGKIVVGGGFTSYSGSSSPRIVRLNSNGTKDLTFNPGAGPTNIVYDMQLQSDNKIVAVGAFTTTYSGSTSPRIVRINTDGTKDFTFNMGTTGFSATQYSAQIQADGKIIVVGANATYSGSAAQRIRRINTNGTLDTTFNIGTAGLNNTTYKTIIQPDQKIVVMGSFTSYSGSAVNRITRINPNGTRDLTFNVGTGFDTATGQPAALELDSSGNIYAGSNFTTYSGSQVNYFVRISPSGSIAPGAPPFPGYANLSGFNTIQVHSILVDSARSIYAGISTGNYRNANYIARLNTDGTLDTTFEQGLVGFSFTVSKIQVQADDKIIVGGNFASYSGSSNPGIVRLNANGTKDTSFNIGTGFPGGQVTNIKIQPDQKIIAMGVLTSYSSSAVNRITRINTDGTRDTTFNPGTGFDSVTVVPSALELDSSGNIYVGSDFLTYSGSTVNRFVKISPSGSIITGSSFYNGYDGTVRAIVVDSSGGIYTGGEFTTYPFRYNGILRLNEDGTADSSFNVGLNGLGNTTDVVRSLKIQPDGKILAGGTFYTYSGSSNIYLVRINPNGSKDTSFNQGTGFDGYSVNDLQLQNDGKIVVGGYFFTYSGSSNPYIVRINPSGSKDTSFNITQGVNYLGGNTEKLLIDNSGSIHVLHYSSTGNPYRYFKYLSSGSLDNNGITVQGTSGTPAVTSLAKDSLNNIFLLGQSPFTVFKQNNNGIVAFENSSNNTSSLFNPGTGFLNTSTNQLSGTPAASVKNTSGDIWLNSSQYPQYYSGSSFASDLFKINQQGKLIATSSYTGNGTVQTLTAQSDGQILAGYSSPYSPTTNPWRFNSNGTFNAGGEYIWYTIYSMQVQSTGKVLIGGDFNWNEIITGDDGEGGTYSYDSPTTPRYLVRLSLGLGYDYTFLVDQINGPVYNINTLPDDSSILTGFFQLYSGAEKENIAKIDANGNLDYTYIVGPGFSAPVYKTALQPDNKLIAAGNFTQYSGSSGVNRLVRLNTNGSIDTTFNPGSGFNNFNSTNSKILIDNLGNIHVAGGNFTSYSGSAVSGYVKILPNGNIDPTGTSGSFLSNQPQTMELLD